MSIQDMLESESFLTGIMGGLATVIIVIVVAVIIKAVKNKSKPMETALVKILSKRNIVNNNPGAGAYIIFEFEDGSRREFAVNPSISSTVVEGDEGKLTYQGAKIICFERNQKNEK